MEPPVTPAAYPAKSATFKFRFPCGYSPTVEWRHRQHDLGLLLGDPGSFLTLGLMEARELDATCERTARGRIDQLRRECDSRHPQLLLEGQQGFDVLWSILCHGCYDPRERGHLAAARPTDSDGRELADGLHELPGGMRELLSTDYYRLRATLHDPQPAKATIENPTPRPYRSTLKEPGRKHAFAPRTRKKPTTPYGKDLAKVRTNTLDLLEGDLLNGRLPRDYEEVADKLKLSSIRFHKLKDKLKDGEGIEFPPADQQRELVDLLKKMQDPGPSQLKLTLLYEQGDGGAMHRAELLDC
jgi:hypothetical protein